MSWLSLLWGWACAVSGAWPLDDSPRYRSDIRVMGLVVAVSGAALLGGLSMFAPLQGRF